MSCDPEPNLPAAHRTHLVWAAVIWNCPAAQALQYEPDAGLPEPNVPGRHSRQVLDAVAGWYCPLGHEVHEEWPLPGGAKLPAAHGVHAVLPVTPAKCPCAHAWQCVGEVRSELVPYFPVAQLVHFNTVPSSCENWPSGHLWQCSASELCGPRPYLPAIQDWHAVLPAAL